MDGYMKGKEKTESRNKWKNEVNVSYETERQLMKHKENRLLLNKMSVKSVHFLFNTDMNL